MGCTTRRYYILRWLLTEEALASALEWQEDEEALYKTCSLDTS